MVYGPQAHRHVVSGDAASDEQRGLWIQPPKTHEFLVGNFGIQPFYFPFKGYRGPNVLFPKLSTTKKEAIQQIQAVHTLWASEPQGDMRAVLAVA